MKLLRGDLQKMYILVSDVSIWSPCKMWFGALLSDVSCILGIKYGHSLREPLHNFEPEVTITGYLSTPASYIHKLC